MGVHALVFLTTITSPGFLRWKKTLREDITYISYTVLSPLYQVTHWKDCRQLEVNNYYCKTTQGPQSRSGPWSSLRSCAIKWKVKHNLFSCNSHSHQTRQRQQQEAISANLHSSLSWLTLTWVIISSYQLSTASINVLQYIIHYIRLLNLSKHILKQPLLG